MAKEANEVFRSTVEEITNSLGDIERFSVIPREIEEILAISTSERRRWLEDGRLLSAGTRTVTLRGRARQITFHVYDPRMVEDLLSRGAVDEAKLTRWLKKRHRDEPRSERREANVSAELAGWEEFDRDGIVR